jgi:hypothetical protein
VEVRKGKISKAGKYKYGKIKYGCVTGMEKSSTVALGFLHCPLLHSRT